MFKGDCRRPEPWIGAVGCNSIGIFIAEPLGFFSSKPGVIGFFPATLEVIAFLS